MGERFSDEQVDEYTMGVLRANFVEPTPYYPQFQEKGAVLEEGDAVGVASMRTIQMQLELMNVDRRFTRDLASMISGLVIKRQHARVFPVQSLLSIEYSRNADLGRFFRRSDIGEHQATKRLEVYEEILKAELEEQREEKKRGPEVTPPRGTIRLIAPFGYAEYQKRLAELEAGVDRKNTVADISLEFDKTMEVVPFLMNQKDIQRILENGLSAEQMDDLIVKLRQRIVQFVDHDQEQAFVQAATVLDRAKQQLKRPGQIAQFPVYVLRDFAEFGYIALRDTNNDPNLDVVMEKPELGGGAGDPMPRHVMDSWVRRFELSVLEGNIEKVRTVDPQRANFLESLLLQDNSEQLIREIKQGVRIELDGEGLDKKDLDQVLARVILNDD